MAYFFPKNKREIFQRTFLKDVFVSFGFEEVKENDYIVSQLMAFYKERFGFPDLPKEQIIPGVEIKSKDGYVKFSFSLKLVEVKILFPAYKNFEFALQWTKIMLDYLRAINVSEITSLSIGKYNQLQYRITNEHETVSKVMKEIFSQELLCYNSQERPSFEDVSKQFDTLSRWEKRIVLSDSEIINSEFIIEYGFKEKDNQRGEGDLTMKTIIRTNENIILKDILSLMFSFNEILDDGFRWCVTDNIINQMRKPK